MCVGANKSKPAKARNRNKNGALCKSLSEVVSMQAACVANPTQSQPLRPFSIQAPQEEVTNAVDGPAQPPRPNLVLLAIIATGVCLATSESVAGTGYRHEQVLSLGGVFLRLLFEFSIRSSFQQRPTPKVDATSKGATNSNRLHIQEEHDQLIQGEPDFCVTFLAANASTKNHYPYLRLVQRTDGQLMAQQACGSSDQFVVTHRLLWGPPGTDIATLRVERPAPVCKHGFKEEHANCRFMPVYTIRESIYTPDGLEGWAEGPCDEFTQCILGEKRTNQTPSAAAPTTPQTTKATKRKAAPVAATLDAAASDLHAEDNNSHNNSVTTCLVPPTPKRSKSVDETAAPAAAASTSGAFGLIVERSSPSHPHQPSGVPSLPRQRSSDSASDATELVPHTDVEHTQTNMADGADDEFLEWRPPARTDSGFDFTRTANNNDNHHRIVLTCTQEGHEAPPQQQQDPQRHHSAPPSSNFSSNLHGNPNQMPYLSLASSGASVGLSAADAAEHFADNVFNKSVD